MRVCRALLLSVAAAGCDYAFRLDTVAAPDAALVEPALARWDFRERDGAIVGDAVSPALDLSIQPVTSVSWDGDALNITAPARIRSPGVASKLLAGCIAAGVVTVEAWVTPQSLDLPGVGPGRIFTISEGASAPANVTLGQTSDGAWVARLRTAPAGELELRTAVGVIPLVRTHLVLVYDGSDVRIYVDGVEQVRGEAPGDLSSWIADHPVGLANEPNTDERAWLGTYHRIEVFDRALSAAAIQARFVAGP